MGKEPASDKAQARWFAWLAGFPQGFHRLIVGRHPDYLFEGFTLSRRGSGWLVVVRGVEISTLRHHVAFGSGDSIPDAFRNVSLAVHKGQWRGDKFNTGVL